MLSQLLCQDIEIIAINDFENANKILHHTAGNFVNSLKNVTECPLFSSVDRLKN